MSLKDRNIKDYSLYLKAFMLVNLVITYFIMISGDLNYADTWSYIENLDIEDGVFAAIAALITFVANGLLPSKFKAVLVFWSIVNPLPSFRAFTHHISDTRVDRIVLEAKYGALPTEPVAQNRLWYQMFKPVEFDPMIFDSHRNYLISRDLTGLAFLFLVIYPFAIWMSKAPWRVLWIYFGYLAIQYLILSIVSRNYGNRFVCNVLAKQSVHTGNFVEPLVARES